MSPDVIVAGGGIAGLSAAFHLARAGVRVVLLEQEPLLATHSSGRNAAIFRELSHRPEELALGRETKALLDGLVPGWLAQRGMVFVASLEAPLTKLVEQARAEGISASLLRGEELLRVAPALRGGEARLGLLCPTDGVIDTDRVCATLARAARDAGAELRNARRIMKIDAAGGRVTGVTLEDGERLDSGAVVICGGAWAATLGASVGAPLPLTPFRRHLALLETALPASHPTVWKIDEEVYFRPESGGALASPCDEVEWPAELPPSDEGALAELARRLAPLAPAIAAANVRRCWAGLRTFAADRNSVIGEDPRVAGLYWLAGLGGHGMTCGPAAGAIIAGAFTGKAHPSASAFSPARLLGGPRSTGPQRLTSS